MSTEPVIESDAREAEKGTGKSAPRLVMVVGKFPALSETFIVEKFLALLARGWDVHVVTRTTDAEEAAQFTSLREILAAKERVHTGSDVGKFLRKLQPALVHVEFGTYAAGVLALKAELGFQTIVSFRGSDIAFWGLEDRAAYQTVWDGADIVHFVSESLWRMALGRGGPRDLRHVIIPDAVDTDYFHPEPSGKRELGFDAGQPDRPFRILSVGRLVWQKGYDYALAAVAELVRSGVHCDYRIIGDGQLRDQILYTIHDLWLDDVVTLVGPKRSVQVRAEMRRSDVMLHASVSEGFSVAVLEAQAMGMPIVCSNAGGLPENVANGISGIVVERRDAHALAAGLARLAHNADLRRMMGEAGRERVLQHFRLTDQIDRFEALYRQLVDPRSHAVTLTERMLELGDPPADGDEALLADLDLNFDARASRLVRMVGATPMTR